MTELLKGKKVCNIHTVRSSLVIRKEIKYYYEKKTIINANVRNAIMINVLVRNKSSLNSFRYNLLLLR